MSRYVDVDDLIGLEECIRCAMCVNPRRSSRGCDGGCRYNDLIYTEVIKAVSQHIDACITDDVEPVVHAHWRDMEEEDYYEVYRCSACGEDFCLETGTPDDNGYNYCPNCGAKMDEEKGEKK